MPLRGYLRRFRKGDPVAKVCDTEHHNRVADILENIEGMGCHISKPTNGSPWTIVIDGTSDVPLPSSVQTKTRFPWGADHPWGLVDVVGTNVTIAAGEFEAGSGVALATAQTTFTIAQDASYIGLKYDPSSGTLSLIGPTQDKPVSGGGVFQTWLYLFSFDGTNATYLKHNLTGNWHAAMYAYEPGP